MKKCSFCGLEITDGGIKNRNIYSDTIFCNEKCFYDFLKNCPKRITWTLIHCDHCNKLFFRAACDIKKLNFCDNACLQAYNKKRAEIPTDVCTNCSKPIHVTEANLKIYHTHFCNNSCYLEYVKRNAEKALKLHKQGLTDEEIASMLRITRSAVTIALKDYNLGNRKSKINNIELRKRISRSVRKTALRGSNHPSFKGRRKAMDRARGSFASTANHFRESKNYTCEICHKRGGGNIHIHHIKSFAMIVNEFLDQNSDVTDENLTERLIECKEFWDLSNLVVVCEKCHKKIHSKKYPELSPYIWKSATTIENGV